MVSIHIYTIPYISSLYIFLLYLTSISTIYFSLFISLLFLPFIFNFYISLLFLLSISSLYFSILYLTSISPFYFCHLFLPYILSLHIRLHIQDYNSTFISYYYTLFIYSPFTCFYFKIYQLNNNYYEDINPYLYFHFHLRTAMDISADLRELTKTPMAVVCAGIKSILDIGRTLEYLVSKGIEERRGEERRGEERRGEERRGEERRGEERRGEERRGEERRGEERRGEKRR